MKRTDFFKKNEVNGIKEVDPLYHTLGLFKMKRPYQLCIVTEEEKGRPDLVSYKYYNTVEYWWLVCAANGIQCPFLEIVPGRELKIPSILDIADFYRYYRIR